MNAYIGRIAKNEIHFRMIIRKAGKRIRTSNIPIYEINAELSSHRIQIALRFFTLFRIYFYSMDKGLQILSKPSCFNPPECVAISPYNFHQKSPVSAAVVHHMFLQNFRSPVTAKIQNNLDKKIGRVNPAFSLHGKRRSHKSSPNARIAPAALSTKRAQVDVSIQFEALDCLPRNKHKRLTPQRQLFHTPSVYGKTVIVDWAQQT